MSIALDLTARALAILGLAWMLAAAMRRSPASLRAFIWTAAFAGLLALPVATQWLPPLEIAVWTEPIIVEAPPETTPPQRPLPHVEAPATIETTSLAASPPAAAPEAIAISGPVLMFALYLAVAALMLIRIAASHARVRRLVGSAEPAGDEWIAIVDEIREVRGIRRAVRVCITDALNVPAVVGVLRPVLLVPADARDWDVVLRRAVALHELAHVARRDMLAQLVEQIACAVYWFIPLAWHGARRAAALRERASDDEVIRAGIPGPAYAERLLGLVRGAASPRTHLATVAMARPSRMRERVMAILDPVARREGLTMRKVVLTVTGAASVVAATAMAVPVGAASLVLRPAVLGMPHPEQPALSPAPSVPAPAEPSSQARQERRVAVDTGLCGPDAENHQFMIGDRNGRKTMTVKISGGGCQIDLRSEGRITFNGEFTDVASIESGGYFRLDTTAAGVRRELEIEPRGGSLQRVYRVGGREAPYDEAARAWFAKFLIDLDRRSAIGVDVRLPHMLRTGGVSAVLDETGQIPSDYARNEYYARLMKSAALSSGDIARALQQAASLTKSDHYAHELIRAFAPRGLSDRAQRAGVVALIEGMDSDHYIAESVNALVASGRPSGAEMDFLVGVLGRMTSDHYKTQVLTRALTGPPLSSEQQARLAAAAASIESDHYASEFLRQVLRSRDSAAAVRQSALDSIQRIQSDHYRNETLRALLEHGALSEAELLRVVELAKPMSDHYEAETLRQVLQHRSANDRVRHAAFASADQLSRHYRESVRR